jgi:hypothetical protein
MDEESLIAAGGYTQITFTLKTCISTQKVNSIYVGKRALEMFQRSTIQN